MVPSIYDEYIRVINEAVTNDNICHFDETLFSEAPVDTVTLTIKNYKALGGMSDFLFRNMIKDATSLDEEAERSLPFQFRGPMGKGLQIQSEGTHIAFTGGTGSLLFLDLVAHLIRKNLRLLNKSEDSKLHLQNFRFILFMSFQSRDEACGLDLCLGLQQLCDKYGFSNFDLRLRFSDRKDPRWDEPFIDAELSSLGKTLPIKKIWVCGPPIMNEIFDRALE